MQRAASVQIETVAEFKAHVKALLRESQLQAAMRFAGIKFESAPFQSLQLQEEVALVLLRLLAVAAITSGAPRNDGKSDEKLSHEAQTYYDPAAQTFALYTLLGVLVWGALGLLWLRDSETCANTAPAVYRLALLLGLGYAAVLAILALAVVALAVDYCLSGKVRMVLILEQ